MADGPDLFLIQMYHRISLHLTGSIGEDPKTRLIVIDEEHESSYKSDQMPKYHARDVAIKLAQIHGASVVLGSATPSVESYNAARSGRYKFYSLKKRAKEASLPDVCTVDMRDELASGNRTVFSRKLKDAISKTFTDGMFTIKKAR